MLPRNIELIIQALKQGGNKKTTSRIFKDKNHMFQNCETGAVSEYSEIETTIDPEVLDYITKWMLKTVN